MVCEIHLKKGGNKVRNKKLGSILLSILISLSMISVLMTISMTIPLANAVVWNKAPAVGDGYFWSTCSLLVDNGNENSIVATFSNVAYSFNMTDPEPAYWFNIPASGQYPPAVAAKKIGSGKVMAIGGGGGSVAYTRFLATEFNTFDTFLNWLTWLDNRNGVSNKTIVWYEGHQMYYKASQPSYLCYAYAENLKALGWQIWYDNTDPITSASFGSDNHIFWMNTIEVGYPFQASEISAINTWVNGGGSLLMGLQSDYGGYEMTDNMSWVLDNLGAGFRLNDDEVCDNDHWTYNGVFNPRIYLTNHQANYLQPYGVSMTCDPTYRDGLPGGKVTYRLTVTNMGANDDSENLTLINDNASWTTQFSVNPLPIAGGQDNYATLTVTIPADAPLQYIDNITVVVTSQGDNTKKDNIKVTAYSTTYIRPPMNDAQTVENVPTRNYGGAPNIYAGSSNTGYKNERFYLNFDLGDGVPSSYTITNAWIYLYCFARNGAAGKTLEVREESDTWSEENLKWNNQPTPGTLITTFSVTALNKWYGVNVTTYVNSQRGAGDNIISFCIKAQTDNLASPDNFSYGFDSKEYSTLSLHPYIVFGTKPVASGFLENAGVPGENVVLQAIVTNGGAIVDNYNVKVENIHPGWIVSYNENLVNVPPGENRFVPVTVTIPVGETPKHGENFILTVTSKTDNQKSTWNDNELWVGYEENLYYGWNLIGFPATDAQTFPDNILPSLYYIWRWDAALSKYVSPSSTAPVVENIGYWVWVENSWMVRIGTPFASDSVSLLGAKWNLIHFPATSLNTTPDNLFFGHTYYMWRWSAENKKYVSPATNVPVVRGVAYWIWIDSSITVHVPV